MLKYGDREFRNLEEQVQKNADDIHTLKMGIKIEKSITLAQLPSYTVSSHLGQYFIVTEDNEKYLYLITLNNNDAVIAENLGRFPARGEQGIQGVRGEQGEPGEKGERGEQGLQGLQGVRGRPGVGWDGLSEIDSTPYDPTHSTTGRFTTVNTIADLVTDKGTPDEDVKQIGLKFEVPAVMMINAMPMYGSGTLAISTNLWMHSVVIQATDGKMTVNARYLSEFRSPITTLLGFYNFLASTNGQLALLTSSFTFNDSSITTQGEYALAYAKTSGNNIDLGRRTTSSVVSSWLIGKNESGWEVFDTVTQMAPIIVKQGG